MMRKASPDTDQVTRSLLQKALRRADIDMTRQAVAYLIHNNDFDWMRKRLAVLTFEECWTYGLEVSYDNDEHIISEHIYKLVGTVKNRNAAGLGSLAYALSEGDESVYDGGSEDRNIKIIAEAIKRHKDFWEWTKNQDSTDKQKTLVEKADKGFRKAGWPWDRAFAQAAAYLAIKDDIPDTIYIQPKSDSNFPLWVAIDKHTQQGKAAIREAAKQINFNANKALWLAFYFESAKCNDIQFSPWWEREVKWRMKKLELDYEEARQTWERLKPIVIDLLKEETEKLQEKLFSVKPIKSSSYNNIQQLLF
jgi:hypothetical protein